MHDAVLPQQPTPANAEVLSVEWLFEPFWPGTRVMARIDRGRAALTDERGAPLPEGLAEEAAGAVASAVRAEAAVVDGVWSAQPFVGEGSQARAWADTLADEGLADALPDPVESERRRAFVAVDLVELDGSSLLDVPFQERRRLLDGVVEEAIQVRVSPVVRLPVEGWLIGWRANGFTHYLAKHMNSRYRPGEVNEHWLKLSLRIEAPSGLIGSIVGRRGKRVRTIRD